MAQRIPAVDDITGKPKLTSTTATELGYLSGVTSSVQGQLDTKLSAANGAASTIVSNNLPINRAVVSDSDGKIAVSTTTSTEVGYLSGVSSAVQTQINGKQPTITGAASTITSSDLAINRALTSDSSGKVAISTTTSTELGYVSGVTSAIQMQLNAKQATITGAATTITSSDLTANRALVSNVSGKVSISPVTSTELGYVSGVTSPLQTQLSSLVTEDLTFLKTDGSRSMTGNLNMGSFSISNVNNLTATGTSTLSNAVITKNSINYGIQIPTSTAVSSNGTLTLSSTSNSLQFLTGVASGFSVVLPSSLTMAQGQYFEIYNTTTSPVTIKKNSGAVLSTLNANSVIKITAQTITAIDGDWLTWSLEVQVASGITNYTTASTTPFATTSATDVQITGFTLTPMAGTYAIWFNSSNTSVTNNSMNYLSLYKDGVQITGTERVVQSVASNFTFQMTAQGTAVFNGSEQLRIYVRVSTGTLTINARSLIMIRLGG